MPKHRVFELWCLMRFFRVPYTTRWSNQSIWKEINFWPSLSQLRHLLRASRCKEWMVPQQKCLTMAAPSKQFVSPPMEKLRKAEGSEYPGSLDTGVAFSPAALEAKQGAFWALEGVVSQGSTGATSYQVGLERTEQADVAESGWQGCGNKREPALHEVPHSSSPGGQSQW